MGRDEQDDREWRGEGGEGFSCRSSCTSSPSLFLPFLIEVTDKEVPWQVRRLADPALLEKGKALWSSALSAATRKKPSLAVLTAWDATNILAVPTGVEVECPWEGCGVKQAIRSSFHPLFLVSLFSSRSLPSLPFRKQPY